MCWTAPTRQAAVWTTAIVPSCCCNGSQVQEAMLSRVAVAPLAMNADEIDKRRLGDSVLAAMLDCSMDWEHCPASKVMELTSLLQQLGV